MNHILPRSPSRIHTVRHISKRVMIHHFIHLVNPYSIKVILGGLHKSAH